MKSKEILVSISCITYNHVSYIRQCLDGFMMQQTDFAFEVLIHDDCSTDGTMEIIREYEKKYPQVIKPMYETENQYSQGKPIGTSVWNLPRAKGKYIAICEGDDYWTDPLKLQKQVDFLEEHEEYVMCATRTPWLLNTGEMAILGCGHTEDCDLTTDEIIRGGGLYLNVASIIYRNGILHRDAFSWWKMADVGDYPLSIAASLKGKVRFLADETTIYRFQHEGSWTSREKDASQNTKHFQNETTWLGLLDTETGGKYREAVYYHLFPRMIRGLYHAKQYSTRDYYKAYKYASNPISKKRLIKDILIYYLPFLKRK